ncbi:MAG: ATP synthase F1 subunit gamma [Spirochaetia bacterium]|nr:ATP synthase F1 subunit gamma [Spirochaetia bacterium]
MATLREIKKRTTAVKNTKQITSTMEMVATAKSKKAVDRVHAAQPYAHKIKELIASISSGGVTIKNPLLRKVEKIKKVAILAVAGNRGLCGGFNNNVVKMAIKRIEHWKSQGVEVEAHLVGKKVKSVFTFQKVPYEKSYTHIQDSPNYENGLEFSEYFMKAFTEEKLDRVEIIYTAYKSSSEQKTVTETVMPIEIEEDIKEKKELVNTIYEPDAKLILDSLLPRAITTVFYQSLLESTASEQIARRIAMKNATDAASDMIKDLTRAYNRARQAKITQEISEIVAGADAIG